MSALNVLHQATAAGLSLTLEPSGMIRVRGPAEARARLLPEIRSNKANLLAILETEAAAAPEPAQEPTLDLSARRQWRVVEPNGDAWTSSFCPPQSLAEVMAWYPGAVVEPIEDPDAGPSMPPDVADLVNGWLNRIGETCLQTRAEALELVRTRPSVQEIYRSMVGVAAPPDLGQAAERRTVSCSSCVHFQPSEPDPSGFGSCRINAPESKRPGTLWPDAEHNCHEHREVSP